MSDNSSSGNESATEDQYTTAKRPRKKVQRGAGWDHFDKVYAPGGKRIEFAKCHICHETFTIGLSTRLKHHELCAKTNGLTVGSNPNSEQQVKHKEVTPKRLTKRKHKADEIGIAYMNYLLSEKKSVLDPCPYFLKDLLNKLGWSDIPACNFIQEHLIDKAIAKNKEEQFEEDVLPALFLETAVVEQCNEQGVEEEYIFALIMAMNVDKQYCYLSHASFENSSSLKENLEKFCDDTVIKATDLYNIKIQAVILNYSGEIESIANFDDPHGEDTPLSKYNYIRTKSFSLFLTDFLKVNNGAADDDNDDSMVDSQLLYEYKSKFESLQVTYYAEKVSLADAVQDIVLCINEGLLMIHGRLASCIEQYFNSFYIGCNYLDYRNKFKLLQSLELQEIERKWQEKLFTFANFLPPKAVADYGDYKKERGGFVHIFNECKKNNCSPFKFWKLARQECSNLADHAIKLLKIPAIPPKVDTLYIYELLKNSNPADEDFVYLQISVLLKSL